jgi:hypothetical protein
LCTLTLAATLFSSGVAAALGQTTGAATAAKPAAPVSTTKPIAEPAAKVVGGYMVHQSIEVGGRITNVSGSQAMWDTLVNQGSGGRVLGQSLEMHSVNNAKTPFFDNLVTSSTGYGGDAIDVTRLKMSKGRWYDFNSSFRRDRNYFDYNLLDQSLLGPTAQVAEPDSLHLFNTVRRNTDLNLTLLPLSFVHFRAGFNHGTHEGPTYTTVHEGGDVQLLQWFRNSADTYIGGVDVNVAKRTTLSYDQFYVYSKGDSSFELAGATYQTSTLTPGIPPVLTPAGGLESLGVDTLATAKCGTANATASKNTSTLQVVNGVANPYCSGTLVQSQSAPTRTTFPTEQLRFASRYWDRVSMNGRFLYSGGVSNVNSFNETFNGLLARTYTRQEIDTGGLANGRFAHNKRVNVNGDFGIVADLNKYIAVSDAFNYWNFRVPGMNAVTSNVWAGTAATKGFNILTPLGSLTQTTTTTVNQAYLNQKTSSNTLMGIFTVTPEIKVSGGWRFKTRNITDSGDDDLTWNINGAILGLVVQPSRMVRINVDYDSMRSKSANSVTPSNTFTREAPNKVDHLRARATIKPAKWVNFAITANDYSAKNDDALVNHTEHNHDVSFATTLIAGQGFSADFNFAHDNVFSVTDLCYVYTATATAPLPPGATNAGTCVNSATNPSGAASLYLGNGYYNVPSNFFAGSINYTAPKYLRLNAGIRANDTNGQAEQLNPYMVPGALHSQYVTPYADVEIHIASQWGWHCNWTHDGYAEKGPIGYLPARNTHGDIFSLGVKYAF